MPTYALVDAAHSDVLQLGRNVIGRGSVTLEGVSFIEISSANSSVSRVQAHIEICPNGDAWICDCNSTNGTFLCIHEGPGVCLEQKHYYQLSDGCRIIFGDVERIFRNLDRNPPLIGSDSPDRVVAGEAQRTVHEDTPTSNRAAPPTVRRSKQESTTSPPLRKRIADTPYLASAVGLLSEETSRASDANARDTTDLKSPPAKRVRSEASSETALAVVACLSGMDAEERDEATRLIRPHGKVVADISKANVLVVKVPAVRTPKFIIAIGRGIPVVAFTCFSSASEPITKEKLMSSVVSLTHEGKSYTNSFLQSVLTQSVVGTPILTNLTFNLQNLPPKSRSVAKDVIVSCGGGVITRKPARGSGGSASVTDIREDNLNDLYDSILSGRKFTP